ncbi:MAG: 23S rRNA (pseudouridine(1915)-N(3))-methyltransferase RlmH [Alphaproteobacteria bacterium]|jgi:23S rRNA (pseudouridine1915-N3)-methyltransferase|nr:23S rRNA (pseudouridine(1915)-N(3))-methyltransferase RlmH [Rhodospirillaceae bacterium]MDP6406833.1 23S rRNA (pseudouridine(1915)-N(3))-methyltransferase RlmH [Alphaproteobacteria bacterium]MDP6621663.1 23S rRNA (pseudouridine(1915)-N(3))-methyltransferase RlmH [Alphaproteobacteria bacterium]|tara:strand:+ start:1695 stop:2153 length:459 start_codon:yes stop_codon:yes gene_type:complete
MRLVIAAVGRSRRDATRELYEDYAGRLPWPVELKEIEERKPLPTAERIKREGERLLAALPEGATMVALDGGGRELSSTALAKTLGRWRDSGVRHIGFVIGGADGLDKALTGRADIVLSLGAMTWPHMLVRVMLAEQLYRASAILTGHPYHRE